MAVEASHFHNREMIYEGNANMFDDRFQTVYTEKLTPVYGTGMMTEFFPANDFRAESGLTCSIPISRKRSRDATSFNPDLSMTNGSLGFLSNDISLQMYQQQAEIDRFVDNHFENVKKEIKEIRRRNNMRLIAISHQAILKKLKTKDAEISKMSQLNISLEEKVKSLIIENQIWRELAQTNEATANGLRANLHEALTQAQQQAQQKAQQEEETLRMELVDDCESYCGTNATVDNRRKSDSGLCRGCRREESCVLVLPCRHLCVCSVCGSSISSCPVCKATKTATLLVSMN